ncbi:predicted protein [Chaetoceros tenuissimus]|uniref:Uncharacterized protein n=1 Tax=Chaetoceros tenuissimus TaxID=426638 RepID=A0AAD3H8T0_9STRA|nr:predicted protein [Chaetoceros tenuissimus]
MSSRRSTLLAQRYLAAIRSNEDSKKESTQDSISRGKKKGEKVIESSASQHEECASLMPIPNSEHVEMEELAQSRNGSTSPSRIRYVRGSSANEDATIRESNGSVNDEEMMQNDSNQRKNDSQEHVQHDIPKWKRSNTFTTNRFTSTLSSHGRGYTSKSRALSLALTDISDPATEITDNRGEEKKSIIKEKSEDISSPNSTQVEKRFNQPWQRRKLKISNDQGWIKSNQSETQTEEEKIPQIVPEKSQIKTGGKQDFSHHAEEDTMAENDIVEQHPTSPQHKLASSEASTSGIREKNTSRLGDSFSRQGAVMFGHVKLKPVHRKAKSMVDDVAAESSNTMKEETSFNKPIKQTSENTIHTSIPDGKDIVLDNSEPNTLKTESEFLSVKARLKSWNTKGRAVASSPPTLNRTYDKPVKRIEKLKASNREVIVDEITDEENCGPIKEMRAMEQKKVIHNRGLKEYSESGNDREDMGDQRRLDSNDNEKAKFSWQKKIERRQIFEEKVKETITVESFIPTKTYLVNSSKNITEMETKTKNEDDLIDNNHAKFFPNARRTKLTSTWQKNRESDEDDTQAISRGRSLLTKKDDTTLESNDIKVDEARLDSNIDITNSVTTKFDAFNKYQQSLRSSSLSRSPKANAKQQNDFRSKSLSRSPKLHERKVKSVPSYTTNVVDKTISGSSVNEQDFIKVSSSTKDNIGRRYSKQSSREISTATYKVQHDDATKTTSQSNVIPRGVGSRPASKGFQSLRSRFEAMSKGQHQSKTNIENASVWCKASDSIVPSTEAPKELNDSMLVGGEDKCDDDRSNVKRNHRIESDFVESSNAKEVQSPSTFNLRDNSPVQFVDGPSTFLNNSFQSQNGNIHIDKTFHSRPSASAFTKFSNPTKNIVDSQMNTSKEPTTGAASPPNDIPWKYIEPNDIPWTDRELLEARERSFEEERNRSFVTQQPDVNFSYGAEYLDYSFEDDDCDGVTLCPTISDVSSLSIPSCIQTIESSSIITDPSQTSDECTRTVESASEKQSTTLGLSEASSSQTSEAATPLIYSTLGKIGMKFATSSDHTGTTNTYRPEFNGLMNTLPPIELNEHEEIEENLFSTVQGETDQFTRNQFEKELKIQNEPQWKNDFFAVDSVKSHPTADSGDASGWVDFPTSVGGFSEQSSVDKTKKAMKVLSKKPSDQGTYLAGQQRSSRGNNIRNRLIQSRLTKSTSASTVSQTEKSPNSEHASEKHEKFISQIPKPQSGAAYRRFNLDKVRAFQRNRRS